MSVTVLVTGANGFLGRAVCTGLDKRGFAVRRAVRANAERKSVEIAVGEIGPTTDWIRALAGVGCVIHCAGRAHVMVDTALNPLNAFRMVNTAGTLNVARQAADTGIKRFIFVSSVKVNGDVTLPGLPFKADEPTQPIDFYGISKCEAEEGLRQLSQETGLEVVIVRPPLIYGPWAKANFAAMMRALDKGMPLPLGAVIHNRRSLVALDNLVDLLVTCIDHPAAANQTFLASDGEDLSTSDLLRRMGLALGKPARLLPVPPSLLQFGANLLGKGDVAQRLLGSLQVDITKTRQLLSWTPPISVDEGLRRAAQGFVR